MHWVCNSPVHDVHDPKHLVQLEAPGLMYPWGLHVTQSGVKLPGPMQVEHAWLHEAHKVGSKL